MDRTKMIDYCKCIYCGHEFDGSKACNYDMDADVVKCPECKKEMGNKTVTTNLNKTIQMCSKV